MEILKGMMKHGGLQKRFGLDDDHLTTIYKMMMHPPKFDEVIIIS